jgi:hypothetical protein
VEEYNPDSFLSKIKKSNRLSLIPYYTRIKTDDEYKKFAEKTIDAIFLYGKSNNDSEDYIVKIYNDYYLEYLELQAEFNKTGRYRFSSYEEVDKILGPIFHKNYIYVLLLSFLTTTYRYEMMKYISGSMANVLKENSENGLEIGFGTGIDLPSRLNYFTNYDIFEINEYSEKIFNLLYADNKTINYNKAFYNFDDENKYSFVQLIELMEHLQDPKKYIDLSHKILKKNGRLIFTTAVNMANIDHIYLFNNLQSVRDLIDESKWKVVDEKCFLNSLVNYPEEKVNDIIVNNRAPYIVTHILKKI